MAMQNEQPTEKECWDNFWDVIAQAAIERQKGWDQSGHEVQPQPQPLSEAA